MSTLSCHYCRRPANRSETKGAPCGRRLASGNRCPGQLCRATTLECVSCGRRSEILGIPTNPSRIITCTCGGRMATPT